MTKVIILSIQSQHAVNILNGDKTLELRTWIPKGYVGWVYAYVTKGKKDILYKYKDKDKYYIQHYLTFIDYLEVLNSKVAFRFWFDEYDDIIYKENEYVWCNGKTLSNGLIDSFYLSKLKLSYEHIFNYGKGKDLYAWHIKQLEIFDKPMELKNFHKLSVGKETSAYIRLDKAPQSWQYVYVKGESK